MERLVIELQQHNELIMTQNDLLKEIKNELNEIDITIYGKIGDELKEIKNALYGIKGGL